MTQPIPRPSTSIGAVFTVGILAAVLATILVFLLNIPARNGAALVFLVTVSAGAATQGH